MGQSKHDYEQVSLVPSEGKTRSFSSASSSSSDERSSDEEGDGTVELPITARARDWRQDDAPVGVVRGLPPDGSGNTAFSWQAKLALLAISAILWFGLSYSKDTAAHAKQSAEVQDLASLRPQRTHAPTGAPVVAYVEDVQSSESLQQTIDDVESELEHHEEVSDHLLRNDKKLPWGQCPSPTSQWWETMAKPDLCMNFNLFYIKAPKTGSSTMGGVARRIAARYGLDCSRCALSKSVHSAEPRVVASHIHEDMIRLYDRSSKLPTFRWGLARDPVTRCLSQFYHFWVTKGGKTDSLREMKKFVHHNYPCYDTLWKYHMFDDAEQRSKMDFMGTTERYNESILLLGYILKLSMSDILYVPSKVSSEHIQDKGHILVANKPIEQQPADVKAYFSDALWMSNNKHDYALHQDANESMDAMIQQIGERRFLCALDEYKKHLDAVRSACPIYDASGRLSADCYWSDNGCNFPCLDEYSSGKGLWAQNIRDIDCKTS